ncbi:TetR/AcrR family transcriptional regulator [Corallococcus praedator]|uniref:TetR/AcrR family transcriptional regulator n=1 Tax=Corallococcus praedator TaxID=2316724 RepID=A0ABX9QSP3_9BACT|nr:MULTISPECIES: TetR/AcrR family transcriptional regulator [Corallococcus]RKH18016.1 TetR/AcrR family transcriptional regulator [Corallococcus sp. CA047B]RKH23251.1 TetR/AcrR family transcriptional regulator [Corallococcus sp. CA031C]RKI15978.1 TetR/AcrR family transcriptional regulator [Corallococcus praedator]
MKDREKSAAEDAEGPDVRARIITAAAELISSGGPDAATTRAVAAAAGVQAPTLYRLFGDKRGLLAAVIEHALKSYVSEKSARAPHPDPLQDFRDGWDMHVAFGLSHPGLFALMSSDPQLASQPSAVGDGEDVLRRRIRNIALAGRLRVSEERALGLVVSMGTGAVLTLLRQPEGQRDLGLSDAAREATVAAITSEAATPANTDVRAVAAALRASIDRLGVLTKGESLLLSELLERIADAG